MVRKNDLGLDNTKNMIWYLVKWSTWTRTENVPPGCWHMEVIIFSTGIFLSCLQQHAEIMCQVISEQKSRGRHGVVNLLQFSFLARERSCHGRLSATVTGSSPLADKLSVPRPSRWFLTLFGLLVWNVQIGLWLTESRRKWEECIMSV